MVMWLGGPKIQKGVEEVGINQIISYFGSLVFYLSDFIVLYTASYGLKKKPFVLCLWAPFMALAFSHLTYIYAANLDYFYLF